MLAVSSFTYGLREPRRGCRDDRPGNAAGHDRRQNPCSADRADAELLDRRSWRRLCVFEGETKPDFLNPLGTVHGGWALTLIDTRHRGCGTHASSGRRRLYDGRDQSQFHPPDQTRHRPRARRRARRYPWPANHVCGRPGARFRGTHAGPRHLHLDGVRQRQKRRADACGQNETQNSHAKRRRAAFGSSASTSRRPKDDGLRVLVDRLWPRGITKEKARIDLWLKEISPSDALRRLVHGDPTKWDEFVAAYRRELAQEPAKTAAADLRKRAKSRSRLPCFTRPATRPTTTRSR